MAATAVHEQAPPVGAASRPDAVETVAIADVWRLFRATGSIEMRNRLIMQYAPLVKYVAGRVRSGLPRTVDPGDLVSDGLFGLIEAIERFDPDRGLEFPTYAVARIRGAMFDALRTQEWVPRGVREKARALTEAHTRLQAELGRPPTEEEVADELGITVAVLRELYVFAARSAIPMGEDAVAVDPAPLPGEALGAEADRRMLMRHVRGLREREQVIIALYYYEGFTLAEIGLVLGVTESRVSQIHSRAMLALRAAVEGAVEV